MAYTKAKGVIIKVKDADGQYINVAGQTGGSLSQEIETIEVYTKDDTTKQVYGTFNSWSVSLENLYVLNDAGMELLHEKYLAKENVAIEIALEDAKFEGEGLLVSMEYDFSQDDMVSFSCEITGAGDLTRTKNA